MALKPCHECKKEISDQADKCPHCGAVNMTPVKKAQALLSLVILPVALVVIYLSLALLTGWKLPGLELFR